MKPERSRVVTYIYIYVYIMADLGQPVPIPHGDWLNQTLHVSQTRKTTLRPGASMYVTIYVTITLIIQKVYV